VKTRATSIFSSALVALLLLVSLPFSASAQELTPAQYRANQEKLRAAIAAMEKEEARQKSGAATLDAKREAAAAKVANRGLILESGDKLAAEDPAIARSRAQIAAREERIRRDASPEMLVQLDPPKGVPVKGNGPAPGAKPAPASANKKPEKKKEIQIYGDGGATFNSKANMIVFEENVRVSHPGFELFCDKLIVFMKPGGATGKDGELPIDKAIAVGRNVIVRKMSDKGELRVGHAKRATFYGDSGDIVLQESPSVQTGAMLVESMEAATIMTLNENGKMEVDGRYNAVIVPEEKTEKKAIPTER